MLECMDEDFRLIQPRGVGRCVARLPPPIASGEVRLRRPRYVARSAILDQKDAPQFLVVLAKKFQFRKIVFGVIVVQEGQLHQPRMYDQEYQHVRCTVSSIVERLLLDRTGDRPADRLTLQDLEGWYLIDANNPDALFHQALRIPIAPKDLLRPFLEPGIQSGGLPVAGAMGLQINIMQQTANRGWANRANDTVLHGLTGQVHARPMRDVQALGNRLQTGQFDDLRPLHRG